MTKIEKTLAEIAEYQKIFEQNMIVLQQNQAKTDEQLAKTDLKLQETKEMLSNIGFYLGAATEEFFIMR